MTKRPKGFFTGAEADAREGRASMSPGTHHGGGGRGGAPGTSTKATHIPTQSKKDTTSGGNGVKKFVSNLPSVKLATMAYKGVKSIFQPKTEQQKVEANIKKVMMF